MSDPGNERLIDALRQLHEARDVDYKAATGWDESNRAACCGVVKDVLAMANSGGGLVIIGVDQLPDNSFMPTGLTDERLKSWETTRLNNFVQRYADPPINCRLRRFNDNSMTFVVIDVPAFPDLPHLCVKEYPGELLRCALYVRTANNESAPLGSSADFNSIIEQAVRNRSDRLLATFRTILTGASLTASEPAREQFESQLAQAQERARAEYPQAWPRFSGFHEAAWWPSRFSKSRIPFSQLESCVQKAEVSYRGWPFLYYNPVHGPVTAMQDGIEVTVAAGRDRLPQRIFDYWQLRQSGLFYQYSLMYEDAVAEVNESAASVNISEVAFYVAEAVDCLARLCDALGIQDEEVTLLLRWVGIQGRALTAYSRPLPIPYATSLPEIRYEGTRPVEEWRAGRVDLSAEITREVLLRFNWPDPPLTTFKSDITALFERKLF